MCREVIREFFVGFMIPLPKECTCATMKFSDKMISGYGKLLFRKVRFLAVSHTNCLNDDVSIVSFLGARAICFYRKFLSGQRKMTLESHKGKGKHMSNQEEESGWGTRAQSKALWEAQMFELELPREKKKRENESEQNPWAEFDKESLQEECCKMKDWILNQGHSIG